MMTSKSALITDTFKDAGSKIVTGAKRSNAAKAVAKNHINKSKSTNTDVTSKILPRLDKMKHNIGLTE